MSWSFTFRGVTLPQPGIRIDSFGGVRNTKSRGRATSAGLLDGGFPEPQSAEPKQFDLSLVLVAKEADPSAVTDDAQDTALEGLRATIDVLSTMGFNRSEEDPAEWSYGGMTEPRILNVRPLDPIFGDTYIDIGSRVIPVTIPYLASDPTSYSSTLHHVDIPLNGSATVHQAGLWVPTAGRMLWFCDIPGPINGPQLYTNIPLGLGIAFFGDVPSGQTLRLDARSKTGIVGAVPGVGTSVYANLSAPGDILQWPGWFPLFGGDNTVHLDGTGAGGPATFYWRDTYR